MTYLKNFINDEEGQDMVEYALLLALIALVAVAGLTILGPIVSGMFNTISGKISS